MKVRDESILEEIEDIPFVTEFSEANKWVEAYKCAEAIDKAFPDQDGEDFYMACYHNDLGPLDDDHVAGLILIKRGERDAGEWVWAVKTKKTFEHYTHFMFAGCDYTGWDCQSSNRWVESYDG